MPSAFELRLDECGQVRQTELRLNSVYIMVYNTYGEFFRIKIVLKLAEKLLISLFRLRSFPDFNSMDYYDCFECYCCPRRSQCLSKTPITRGGKSPSRR